ncbi:Nucleotide-binding universal stress protein, UspA family [Micromonospora viridifaciens]|uniref:Nucleotide-binding universal stress protein, UspA family n=1 Tax=Micromonospora viridifaciens TaxID=1881 RepID=A0A1C4YZJ1_MICVI|nr:universal stress protein [Micromonospora viridifaciens]SCF25751.1 Nucleotide-binding universal stress protein, UspA family [Micromonospora viridifaciens]
MTDKTGAPVVVGVDGSPTSLTAAEHAARAAVARSRPLHLVHGYLHPLGYGVPLNPYDLGVPAPTAEAQKMLERVAAELAERHPGLRVEVRQVAGGPGATLVEESRRAELVVVGSRGVGGFAGLLLGSVSNQVAQHARCPVLVVRPAEQPVPVDGPVLVGVDGSEPAALAVRLAADEAERRGTDLVLAHVRPPERAGAVPEEAAGSAAAEQAESEQLLASSAARIRADHPVLTVSQRPLRAASAEQALIAASGEAALVVVGSRGRGGFAGLLLGSVSQALVQHAHCPVLVAHRYEPAD